VETAMIRGLENVVLLHDIAQHDLTGTCVDMKEHRIVEDTDQ
jgi:hypothetical protein